MKPKPILYSLLLLVLTDLSYGQNSKTTRADKKYDNYAYVDAITTYEKLASRGYEDQAMFQKLGNAYYFTADLNKAAQWYEALFKLNPDQEAEYCYRYSQALKASGDYKKADKMLELFQSKSGNDLRAKLFKENPDYLSVIKANSGRFTIEDAGINSNYSDYGASIVDDKLVFASARDTGGAFKKVFRWTNQSFTNLYASDIDAEGNLGAPKRFEKAINSKFHESTPVFTKDGKTMYFTRNNYLEGKKGKDAQRITLLKLYKANLVDDKWSNVTELPFNSDNYSVAHPALSVDEQTLYFASDMPGTLGQSDLFKVTILKNGGYSSPENLGSGINTEGRETFPFISQEGELYFASDGRPGLGGLDIYVATADKKGGFNSIENVGAPVNSNTDDFSFLINSQNRKGFFTSNRSGGHGYDDIYKFVETKKLACNQALSGVITDLDSKEILVGSKVMLFDEKFAILEQTTTDANGLYGFEVFCNKKYYVRAEKEAYETNESNITIAKTTGASSLPIALSKRIKMVGVGSDLAKTLNIPIIYFDLDKSNIRKDAEFELEKILIVMNDNPKMKVDIRSHTDSRQTNRYNEALSDRRAQSTRAWLIAKGIAKERLTAKGYGESQLINGCADGVACSEAEHQANRRSEFIVVAIE
ncbi:OmpA family protein [Flavobacterium crassostreae]|uniref:Flagellar motor protein MotB n=1 Tax=Flavobacterium crassostreae TaxID=1763534 RepID=A0A1B9E4G6_9FLAO|nr:OmpA family protein [Flavobacterium crassostreae]OCB76836.1 flagellar motor protein MotB [Flavobacterium crassostreae]